MQAEATDDKHESTSNAQQNADAEDQAASAAVQIRLAMQQVILCH